MAKKAAKSPMKSIARVQSKQAASLQNIGAVLQQQTEAINAIGAAGAQAAPAPAAMAGNTQVIAALNKIANILTDNNEYGKKMVINSNKQIDAIWKANKDWKGFGDKFKDFTMKMRDNLNPDTMKKAFFGNFSMFKGARNKVEDIDFKKQMRAMGDTRSNKELNAAAKDSREKKTTLLRAEDQIRKIKATGVSDEDLKRNRPDLLKARNEALKSYQDSRMATKATAQGKPPTPAGNFTGDQPSAPLNKNTPKGNFTGDQPSAPLVQLPSDKGQVAQSTTDLAAELQQKSEMERERTKMITLQTDLLQQIASNTAAMSGKKSSSAGGPEDSAGGGGAMAGIASGIGALGGGIGKGMEGLSKGIGAMGSGLAQLGQGLGKGLIGLLQGLAQGMAALANPASLLGLGAFTLATIGIAKALEIAAPAIEAFAPVLQTLITTIGDVFKTGLEKLPDTMKAVGDVIGKIGEGVIGTIKAIAEGIVSIVDAIGRLFGRSGSDAKNAKAQGKATASKMVSAIRDGAKGGQQTDAQKDSSSQNNGFYLDENGKEVITDAKKYENYHLEKYGYKPSGNGKVDRMNRNAAKMRANAAGDNMTLMKNEKGELVRMSSAESENFKNQARQAMPGNTVVQQNNTSNNTTNAPSGWARPRNEESSVSSYIRSRFAM